MTNTVKSLIFVIFLLILMIGGLVWYFVAKPSPSLPTVATSTSPTTPANVPQTPTAPLPAAQALHIIESGKYYDIDMQYPSHTPLSVSAGTAADTSAIDILKAFTRDTIAQFKKDGDFANLTPQAIQGMGLDSGQKYSLSDGYKTYTSPGTVSYVFTIDEDTLGAHPNSIFKTFTFNDKTGQNLALADLFNPGTDYLGTLSTIARASLSKQLGPADPNDFINTGTAPTNANFQNFALDGTNLVLLFPPYQVAPYSSGPQTVRIPLSQLSSVLRSNYQ